MEQDQGWYLVAIAGNLKGQEFPVNERRLSVGREDHNDLVLHDDNVSRRHLEIHVQDARVIVSDLGSRNGTFINNQRITGNIMMGEGDRLALGSHLLEVRRRGRRPPPMSFDDEISGLEMEELLPTSEEEEKTVVHPASTQAEWMPGQEKARAQAAAPSPPPPKADPPHSRRDEAGPRTPASRAAPPDGRAKLPTAASPAVKPPERRPPPAQAPRRPSPKPAPLPVEPDPPPTYVPEMAQVEEDEKTMIIPEAITPPPPPPKAAHHAPPAAHHAPPPASPEMPMSLGGYDDGESTIIQPMAPGTFGAPPAVGSRAPMGSGGRHDDYAQDAPRVGTAIEAPGGGKKAILLGGSAILLVSVFAAAFVFSQGSGSAEADGPAPVEERGLTLQEEAPERADDIGSLLSGEGGGSLVVGPQAYKLTAEEKALPAGERKELAQEIFDQAVSFNTSERLKEALREFNHALALDGSCDICMIRANKVARLLKERIEKYNNDGLRYFQALKYEQAYRSWERALLLLDDPNSPAGQRIQAKMVEARQQHAKQSYR